MPALCRDCLTTFDAGTRCPACGRPRVISHPELFSLSVAHMDCDAFYASVEKRDDPSLRDKPVIVGGGHRGVVSTACYIARVRGVRSAMPMFQALRLCPEATVVRGRMDIYVGISRQIRAMMEELTPVVEPLSLDEAFLDLTGTGRLHHAPPALMLARLARRIETELGLTISIGLSHNKFLAKIASDLEKPRGFAVIGRAETVDFLRPRPVKLIWGVGERTREMLETAGIRTFADLHRWSEDDLMRRFGHRGQRLWHLARGEDRRRVTANAPVKSISNETTFHDDIGSGELLEGHLWRLGERVSDRAKARDLAGTVVTLKLKRTDFRTLTRRITLREATQSADTIFRTARALMLPELASGPFRLIGTGLSHLVPSGAIRASGDLLDPAAGKRAAAEKVTDEIRARFGAAAIVKGRSLR